MYFLQHFSASIYTFFGNAHRQCNIGETSTVLQIVKNRIRVVQGVVFWLTLVFRRVPDRGTCFCFSEPEKPQSFERDARQKKSRSYPQRGLLLLFRSQKNHSVLRETRAKKKAEAGPKGTRFCFFRNRKNHCLLEGSKSKKKERTRRKARTLFLKTSFFSSIQMNF